MEYRFWKILPAFVSILCLYLFGEGMARPQIFLTLCQPSRTPSYLKICSKSSTQLNKCVKMSIEQLRPKLARGIPDLRIPPFDPLVLPELVINQDGGLLKVTSQLNNITVRGVGRFNLTRVNVDLSNNRINLEFVLPSLSMVCNYEVDGDILTFPITGSGKTSSNFSDVLSTATVNLVKVNRNGKMYYSVTNFVMDFNVGDASIRVDNLFGGNSVAGGTMNALINQNWQLLFQEMKPFLGTTVGGVLKDASNKILNKFTINELFKP